MSNTEPSADSGHPRWSKRTLFLAILAAAAAIAGTISLIAYTFVDRSAENEVRLALVAPLSGPNAGLGQAMRGGAELYAEQVNRAGGLKGRPLRVVAFDDGDDPVRARAAAEQAAAAGAVGVVGHWSGPAAMAAAEVYRAHGLPALTIASEPGVGLMPPAAAAPEPARAEGNRAEGAGADPVWLFRNSYDQTFEIRFLANYIRNVLGEKMVSIIHTAGAEGEAAAGVLDEVMQRFGTKVLYRWGVDPADPLGVEARTAALAQEIKEMKLAGAVVLLTDGPTAARQLAALRAAGVRNRVAGGRVLASNAFISDLSAAWKGPGTLALALNGVVVVTPLLYDTAGELAQDFRNHFITARRSQPDWLAAAAYDGIRLLGRELAHLSREALNQEAGPVRRHLRDHMTKLDDGPGSGRRQEGVLGIFRFDRRGVSQPNALVGIYNGIDLIAAPTQLSPIREENVSNYLDEIVAGRALYVNDRFMYKTNVVYAGLKVDKLSALDLNTNTVTLDFMIWFRWRGGPEPQDVIFANAVEPIRLDKPEREERNGELIYRAYRARGKFFLDYSGVEHAYGTKVVGLTFRHRTLARNNLMYVGDILGMDLNTTVTLAEQMNATRLMHGVGEEVSDASLFQKVVSALSPGTNADPLVQALNKARILAGVSGWVLERAWLSQDIGRRGPEGDPTYVGFGKPAPEFSELDMGSVLKPDQPDVHDLIPHRYFLAIAIFSLVGAVVANLLDRKDRGQFWRIQSLGLRIVSWPLLLLSAGTMGLDYGVQNLTPSTVDLLVVLLNSLWWVVPARLVAISVERFIWVPLELRTGKKIPNIVRVLVALVIYLFAIFGVIAFVMGKTVTSLLATSGLMAMLIGFAIQANIANIFSGIILNLERPFQVGDYIKVSQSVMGQVIDITWRTTRIRHLEGQLVCLANGKVSEAEIHNFSNMDANFVRLQVYVDPRHDPSLISRLVKEALDGFDIFQNLASAYFGPGCQFKGVECTHGVWAARYRVKFYVKKGNDENVVVHNVLASIWERFQAHGIDWAPAPGEAMTVVSEAVAPRLLTSAPA